MGMAALELDNITMRRLFNKLRGFQQREREEWERLRLQCYFAFSPIDPSDPDGKSMLPLLEFMPFEWDNELPVEDRWEQVKRDAQETRKRSAEMWAKIDNM